MLCINILEALLETYQQDALQELGTAKAEANQLQTTLFEKDSSLQRTAAEVRQEPFPWVAALERLGAREGNCVVFTQMMLWTPAGRGAAL